MHLKAPKSIACLVRLLLFRGLEQHYDEKQFANFILTNLFED